VWLATSKSNYQMSSTLLAVC